MDLYRIEKDTLGEIKVQKDKYWGAQTQRSIENFKIGPMGSMPIEIIEAFGLLKKSAAEANYKLGLLTKQKHELIAYVCDEIIEGKLNDHFPLVIWQTGSGTQTNMNVNEVISNRALVLAGGKLGDPFFIHPNDEVNKSQSSNDTYPTAMHIAAYKKLKSHTIPSLKELKEVLEKKISSFSHIIKIGRTHLMDATPLSLSQEFSAYLKQVETILSSLDGVLEKISFLALGGTAVGTGLNAPKAFASYACDRIAYHSGYPFKSAVNKFSSLSFHDEIVEGHAILKQLAVFLMKLANDIRLLGSGPRSGIGELILPENEPGSSIMPGKVNPTQTEALSMVCAQVMGNDVSLGIGASMGHLQLNVFKPLIIYNFLESAGLLGDACRSFTHNCLKGLKANESRIKEHLDRSLMLVTSLTPHIGYDKSAQIAKLAHKESLSLKEAGILLGYLSSDDFDKWVDVKKMI